VTAKKLLLAATFILCALALWAFWWEPSGLKVVHHTITLEPWHAQHVGLKIAVMSDLHIGAPHRSLSMVKDLVAVTNAEKPDLVLILGDLLINDVVGGTFVHPQPIADELGELQAPLGVVAVLGNHDWWYSGNTVRRALQSQGIRVLENENLLLSYRGKSFWLCGLADLWTRGDRLLPTLAGIQGTDPVLVLMHNPDLFPDMPERVSLSVAGHTHGGQVNLPIVGRLIVPSKFGQRYAYGLIEEDGRKLFVTGGVGTSILPVRFRVPPEVVILTLQN
jgi:predicted MPP superfamily phosphohydrolase